MRMLACWMFIATVHALGWCAAQGLTSQAPSFSDLRKTRAAIIRQIDNLREEVASLQGRLADGSTAIELAEELQVLREAVLRVEKQLESAKKQEPQDPKEIDRLDRGLKQLQDDAQGLQTDLDLRDADERKLAGAKSALNDQEQALFDIDSQISEALIRGVDDQQFRFRVSLYFSVIVILLIVGFYLVVFREKELRFAIFSGQSGMQFITIFSLITSIALFGILGILESKELSALLGGLSGFILGRYNQGQGSERREQDPKTNATAVEKTSPPIPSPTP